MKHINVIGYMLIVLASMMFIFVFKTKSMSDEQTGKFILLAIIILIIGVALIFIRKRTKKQQTKT